MSNQNVILNKRFICQSLYNNIPGISNSFNMGIDPADKWYYLITSANGYHLFFFNCLQYIQRDRSLWLILKGNAQNWPNLNIYFYFVGLFNFKHCTFAHIDHFAHLCTSFWGYWLFLSLRWSQHCQAIWKGACSKPFSHLCSGVVAKVNCFQFALVHNYYNVFLICSKRTWQNIHNLITLYVLIIYIL